MVGRFPRGDIERRIENSEGFAIGCLDKFRRGQGVILLSKFLHSADREEGSPKSTTIGLAGLSV